MSVFIENEYGKNIDIDYNTIIKKVVEEAIDFVKCPFECEVNVTIVDNDSIKEINKAQRDIDKETDVLSFPLIDYDSPADFTNVEDDINYFNPDSGELMLGDIVISYDRVISQAYEYNHSKVREIAFLTAHSMLHLSVMTILRKMREDMETNRMILNNLGLQGDLNEQK
ncbi:MAG: rRNA maturation RNase YbeY [Eubacterium sp.]